jgi:hypothetical protein
MDYLFVSSSNVAARGYESETSTLGVRLLDGSEYLYFGVPEDIFVSLQAATSIGTYEAVLKM